MKELTLCILGLALTGVLVVSPCLSAPTLQGADQMMGSQSNLTGKQMRTETQKTKALGGIAPEKALEYLKSHPDVVIVQVNTAQWKIDPGFTGALWIPHDEMSQRYNEIPKGRPVMLHCGAGVVAAYAYDTLLQKRPDIPELGFIKGSPREVMKNYNAWLKSK